MVPVGIPSSGKESPLSGKGDSLLGWLAAFSPFNHTFSKSLWFLFMSCFSHCSLNPGWTRRDWERWKSTRGAIGTADIFSGQQQPRSSGRTCTLVQNKSDLGPSGYNGMCMHSATSELNCYITKQGQQNHCLQNTG